MNIRDWWNRLLSKFGKKDSAGDADRDPVPVVELVVEEAPEPVPERKTSDETIVEMAESTLVKEEVRMHEEIPAGEEPRIEEEIPADEEIPDEEPPAEEEIPAKPSKEEVLIPQEEEFPEQEEDPWYEEETDNTGEEE